MCFRLQVPVRILDFIIYGFKPYFPPDVSLPWLPLSENQSALNLSVPFSCQFAQSNLPIEYHGPSEKAEIQATGFVMNPLPHSQNYRWSLQSDKSDPSGGI